MSQRKGATLLTGMAFPQLPFYRFLSVEAAIRMVVPGTTIPGHDRVLNLLTLFIYLRGCLLSLDVIQ